jgi:hypothetical protein
MVDTSKLDVEVVVAEPMKYLYMEDLTEAFGRLTRMSLSCPNEVGIYPRWVVFNPVDFYRTYYVLDKHGFDRSVLGGIVGYLFSAVVILEDIPRGEVYVSGVEERENIFDPTFTSILRKVLFR